MPEENIYVIQQELWKTVPYQNAWWKLIFFIFYLTDVEKQKPAPVTNSQGLLLQYESSLLVLITAEVSRHPEMSIILKILVSVGRIKRVISPHYCRWIPHRVKSSILTIFLSVRKCNPVDEWAKCQQGLAVSQQCSSLYDYVDRLVSPPQACQLIIL